ncbi:SAM-dependent methyltransferase [Mycobacterium palustre]|uniref:S-adenosyl-L-methionine-dependent methyltransferase n=1 Tax=Mycobacterium palustre TaxID=153971 RepID=A0A1X1Z8J4_9MYCO|nr:SAM-dependent methyltransferase [Mycobacterium palustre]ORW19747.1 hypothetical protein AWC19_16250 [Mycobacterium palustre]
MIPAKKEWLRSEGDQWDVVTSVGYTALAVAAARAIVTSRPNPPARDVYAESFVRASGEPYLISLIDGHRGSSEAAGPGWPEFISLQMQFFDTFFDTACVRGLRQVVIMAAGLDARAFRLAWPAGTQLFEVDQADVLDFKSRVLDARGAAPTAERHEVRVDLRDDWVAALIASGFDPTLPTAWLVEGLLMYLPGAAHDALLERINENSARGSELATHVFWPADDFVGMFDTLSENNDPFAQIKVTDLFYDDPRVNLVDWFSAQGWHVSSVTAGEISAQYGRPLLGISKQLDRAATTPRFVHAVR